MYFAWIHHAQHYDNQYNGIQHKATQHKWLICDILHTETQHKRLTCDNHHKQHSAYKLKTIVLSVVLFYCSAEWKYTECHHPECL